MIAVCISIGVPEINGDEEPADSACNRKITRMKVRVTETRLINGSDVRRHVGDFLARKKIDRGREVTITKCVHVTRRKFSQEFRLGRISHC